MDLEGVHPDDFLRRINEAKVKMPVGPASLHVNVNNSLCS